MKIMRFVYRIVSILLVCTLISLVLLSLLLGISGMDRQDPKSVFGFRAFIVLTSSMVPEFNAGSLIIIKHTDAENYKIGDIITYSPMRGGDALLTHRITAVNENVGDGGNMSFTTRGDSNNTDDPNPVEPDNILGRVIYSADGLGIFLINLRTPAGLGAMAAVIALGLFVIPALLAAGEKRKPDEDKNDNKEENKESKEDKNEIKNE